MRGLLPGFWVDLRRSKHYVIAALLAFASGWAAGWTGYGGMDAFFRQSMEGMEQLAGWILAADHPRLLLFAVIFFNNAIKMAMFVLSGALFGVLPIAVLITNGGMLGYMLRNPMGAEIGGLELFARGILPHGILELTALIVACAYGIRFGFLLVRCLVLALHPSHRGRAIGELMQFLTMLVPLMFLLTAATFLAAVIETTVTPALLR